jgi:hypothetical protein
MNERDWTQALERAGRRVQAADRERRAAAAELTAAVLGTRAAGETNISRLALRQACLALRSEELSSGSRADRAARPYAGLLAGLRVTPVTAPARPGPPATPSAGLSGRRPAIGTPVLPHAVALSPVKQGPMGRMRRRRFSGSRRQLDRGFGGGVSATAGPSGTVAGSGR